MIFILGSPRTGSTLIYQLIINFFKVAYFTNFTNNYFSAHPVFGTLLSFPFIKKEVAYKSKYGKIKGLFAPSEGSLVFRNWFGGDHPSQSKSCDILPDKRDHMIYTFHTISKLIRSSVVTKNAWNCFRIKTLSELFPEAYFVWVRRDIGSSALSDLKARRFWGSPYSWNSATTTNYEEIQKRPFWEQVVEQQYSYNQSIKKDLNKFCLGKYIELWYEDICENLKSSLDELSKLLGIEIRKNVPIPDFCHSLGNSSDEDWVRIGNYLNTNTRRFYDYRRV